MERAAFATIDLWDDSVVPTVSEHPAALSTFDNQIPGKKFGYICSEIYVPPNSLGLLELPRHPLGLRPDAREPNILFIAIEGGRSDALDDQTMPNLSRLGRDSFRLTRHFSSGNETRFGIFGLLYGIPGSYWHAGAEPKNEPALVRPAGRPRLRIQNHELHGPQLPGVPADLLS